MTGRRAWAGVDLGTQSVRAVVAEEDGTVIGRGSVQLAGTRDGGRHEQDPESWWRAVVEALRRATGEAGGPEVAGIACCGTSGTILLVEDVPGDPARPLTRGLMYDDSRATAEAARIAAAPAPVWAAAGLRPQRTWALPKALWLHERHPGPGARVAHQVDLITSRLIGRPAATDTSNALKTGADPVTGTWPHEDLDRLGLPPALLPSLVRPGDLLGHVDPAVAEATGLREGTRVVAGMTDGCAAQIAAGVLEPGRWSIAAGTTTVLKGVADVLPADPTGVLYSHRSPDGRWWPGGASSAGAGLVTAVFGGPRPDLEGREVDAVTYPLTGTGERFPFQSGDAVAFTVGDVHDDADRHAAILRGVVLAARLCLDHVAGLGLAVEGAVTLTGGVTRSEHWIRLHADGLGREVRVPAEADGALGMAVLAAAGADGLVATSRRMLAPARVYPPERLGRLDALYARLVGELVARGWLGEGVPA
ncbi:FGGY-family carbohydrate kinase [Phytomonospora endophytica]|uniref:Xylulokinase n=1 Tax=Phytomonospora endophytica TaxID=714109 RepID=A0A841FX80_9ACTN|nr:FGGY family carbohydrate kinase [Phytomonospora endophytica]MBB6038142.1 xylulokinase [Phytomonospora endophytica]GIG67395.1 carbohydrate kinase [Phytomonospora endophytica]